MALSSEQKSSKLFKQSLGKGETLIERAFFNEPFEGRPTVFPDQIWNEAGLIPETAPSLTNNQESGVVKYFELLELQHVGGANDKSYFAPELKDTIPFNYGDGESYNYAITKNNGTTPIPFGQNDWIIDTSAGLLTFYNGVPSGVNASNPPKISFYKYIGEKGVGSGSGGANTTPFYQSTAPDQVYDGSSDLTNITLDADPAPSSVIEVYVNGQRQRVGETTSSDCWFGTATVANNLTELSSGDALIWNATATGFSLETNDLVDIVFKVLV
jgi:hypothetical protein